MFSKAYEAPPEVKPLLVDARAERPLKVRAVNPAIGRAETRLIGAAEPHAVGGDPLPGPAVAVDELGRLSRGGDDWTENPEAAEFAGGVGRQRDRRADFSERRRLLVDVRGKATTLQGEPEREASDAGADDRDFGFAVLHIQKFAT